MLSVLIQIKRGMIATLNFILIVAVALLVVDVVWGVFSRYIMGAQTKWTEELARFLLIWVALLGGAVAFSTKGHLGIDCFTEKFHPDVKKPMAVFSHIVVLFFAVSVFLYGGSHVVANSLAVEQTTPALGWKMGYVYLALPISGIFMVLFTIENLIETLIASGGESSIKPDSGTTREAV